MSLIFVVAGSNRMSRFRPCIDLHAGRVKQIVGGSLSESGAVENHVSPHDAAWFARRYRSDALTGGHVICLGPGNESAARDALAAYPGGLQIGGGVGPDNAKDWLDAGASHVIVTSWLFDGPMFCRDRLKTLADAIGRRRIVVDLSCRKTDHTKWHVASNRWQTRTELSVDLETLDTIASHCDEFLVHAADVEGRCGGVDEELVRLLGRFETIPITYAGGIASMDDIELIESASAGKLDYTVGSSLDLFGGTGVKYESLIARGNSGRLE